MFVYRAASMKNPSIFSLAGIAQFAVRLQTSPLADGNRKRGTKARIEFPRIDLTFIR